MVIRSRFAPRLAFLFSAIVAPALSMLLGGCSRTARDATAPASNRDAFVHVQDDLPGMDNRREGAEHRQIVFDLTVNKREALPGYTLVAPMNSPNTYLLDMEGRVVHRWKSDCKPGLSAYLLENGHLLRAGLLEDAPFEGSGTGGRIQEFTWDGKLVWDFKFADDTHVPHHDIKKLPNGNVLMIVWERKTAEEAVAAGRRADSIQGGLVTADCIIEIKPTGRTTGQVVWEWHAWDHLVQGHDESKSNYGTVSAHPELIDVNFGDGILAGLMAKKDGLEQLRSIGYLGASKSKANPTADWTHVNSVAYNPELDQILLSVHEFNEIWIIDHGTTTAQAAGHKDGRRGKGGDLLYRWGNPRAYGCGARSDQRLFGQHDAQWIARGAPGEGHILVFNNGSRNMSQGYSSVDEIIPPLGADGAYGHEKRPAFGPDRPEWTYAAPKKEEEFFSTILSSAQRLANGNTFICSGIEGALFEVTPAGEVVWKCTMGFGIPGRTSDAIDSQVGQILSPSDQESLRLSPEQETQLRELQKHADDALDQILNDEQKEQLANARKGPMRTGPRFVRPKGPAGVGIRPPGLPHRSPGGGPRITVFGSMRYAADFPGLAGRDLRPETTKNADAAAKK
jgi:hypothetical protein